VADDERPLTLAFFRADRYLIHPETGAIAAAVRELTEEDVAATPGWEVVTRAELFERWPEWRAEHELLHAQLEDHGSA
jgi:hypothetical protein